MAQSSSPSPSHKPRKRLRPKDDFQMRRTPSPANVVSSSQSLSLVQRPAYPLAAFLWPARTTVSRWAVLPLVLIIAGLFRWSAGLWGYSGFQAPPMHGDFEAQRHWMEVTTNLPMTQWYFHELEWWGLDYPPLTAYHSWLVGKMGCIFNRSWFALRTSRGLDDPTLKVFMRASVMVSEYLTYVPALVIFVRSFSQRLHVTKWHSSVALTAILFHPATILIDHAHFQYNTVMLGFVLASLACILSDHLLWASVFFVAALGFKQMALYYAPAIFAFLLGSCTYPHIKIIRLIGIGLITVLSFIALFAPLALGSFYDQYRGISMKELEEPPLLKSLKLSQQALYYPVILQLAQSVHRIFPFARGLFEDKVANFWCAIHTFHKLHKYPTEVLQRVSLGATAASILPPCLLIGIRPRRTMLPLALATTAWGFFLFSFQVHEKSVLLPLLPMTLLLALPGGLQSDFRAWISWANTLGSWTLFPLLKRDQLRIPYFVLTLLWTWLMGQPAILFSNDRDVADPIQTKLVQLLHGSFYLVMIAWHFAEAFIPPPNGKPDLWVVTNVLVGFAGFSLCYLWCLYWLAIGLFSGEIQSGPISPQTTKRKKKL